MGLSKNWSTFESKFLDWTIRDALVMAFTYERVRKIEISNDERIFPK